MAKKKTKAEVVAAIKSLSTVKSSDKAAAEGRRDDIRSGRKDIDPRKSAHDNNSILERYDRRLADLDSTIGRASAEKRKLLQAKLALLRGDAMGDPNEDPEPVPQDEEQPEREEKAPAKPEEEPKTPERELARTNSILRGEAEEPDSDSKEGQIAQIKAAYKEPKEPEEPVKSLTEPEEPAKVGDDDPKPEDGDTQAE